MGQVWINGRFEDEQAASLSLRDAGLLHAAGVFTTMRAAGGRAFRLEQHLQRVRASCEALFVPSPFPDDVLSHAATELLARNSLLDARMRLTVTRGVSAIDPLHGARMEPSVFMTAGKFEPYPPEFYEHGLTVMLLDEQKLNPFDMQAGHKTLNYLSRLAALREANRRGAGEALWFDTQNYLQSGSVSTVFIVKDDALHTPPAAREHEGEAAVVPRSWRSPVLPGITRRLVLEIAKSAGIAISHSPLDVEALLDADEVFLTNSVMGVMPVCRLESKPIAAGRPGSVTRRLGEAYDRALAAHRELGA